MKILFLSVVLLFPLSCLAQNKKSFKGNGLQVSFGSLGLYSSSHSDIPNWVNSIGGHTSQVNHGYEYFNISNTNKSNFICGVSTGTLLSKQGNSSSLKNRCIDLYGGTNLVSTNRIQLQLLFHGVLSYSYIYHIVPPNIQSPSRKDYIRGTTFGAGPSLRFNYTIIERNGMSFGAAVESGVTFFVQEVQWKYGHVGYRDNNYSTSPYSHNNLFRGQSIEGPTGESRLSYLRFSLFLKIH